MGKMFKQLPDGFFWDHVNGIGHSSVEPMNYEDSYFQNYVERDKTPMGKALTKARVEFVEETLGKLNSYLVTDIGIGGGGFVKASGGYGYDVSESAKKWLIENNRWRNPGDYELRGDHKYDTSAMSFWDSLEHIEHPELMLSLISRYAFISMPIYKDKQHCLNSKHYKPGEHIWYFTRNGLINFMRYNGFKLGNHSLIESHLGREDIESFAFERVSDG